MSKKDPIKTVSVPDYWLARFQAVVEELSKTESYLIIISSLLSLDKETLYKILTEPVNSII